MAIRRGPKTSKINKIIYLNKIIYSNCNRIVLGQIVRKLSKSPNKSIGIQIINVSYNHSSART